MKRSLTLDKLSIGYNGQPVLSEISLAIARDSFTAILGVNGSGKSTLLKTLLGLLPPIAGRIDTAASTGAPLVFGLRATIHSVRSDLSVDGLRCRFDGHVRTHPPGPFGPVKRTRLHARMSARGGC